MKFSIACTLLVTLTFACAAAEIDISTHDNGIMHRLTVTPDDVVVIRTVQGPATVLRFISMTVTNACFIWCYLGESPETKCSDVETVPLIEIVEGQKRTSAPGSRTVQIVRGLQAEGRIKAGEISVLLNRLVGGSFGLLYFRENARLDLLPAGLSSSGGLDRPK